MISLDTPVANTGNSTFRRFLRWCEGQERNRFGWLGLALAVHGCALTPITLFAIILSGNFIGFWVVALIAMGMALVTNLAAMPTKITIPTFLASIVLDLGVILTCLFLMFR
jgi:hypothetical protein